MQLIHGLRFDNIRGDIYGGITAAVVALPLALAFGVASGAGPIAGLYGAVFVGLFAALFGGTPSQISGPTGPMTVVMAGVITQYAHEPAMAFTVVMMAGACQVVFGVARLGRYVTLMPYPVVSGFMTGIGCIIIILQTAPMLGFAAPQGGTLASLGALPEEMSHPVWDALIVGLLSLAICSFWPRRLQKIVPAPLVALLAGTLLVAYVFGKASILGDIPSGFPAPTLPTLSLDALPQMIISALVLGALGSIDSLLTSLIADSVTGTHHHSDRELIGQGIGNMVAGAFGGIPGAGATMHTVVNVRTGGQTPISGALHAFVLLAVVLGLGSLARFIPHAVLAGILFKVGIDIIDWRYVKRLRTAPLAGIVLMLVVLLLTVFVDLIMAVGVGLVLASLLFVKRMADLQLASVKVAQGREGDGFLSPEESDLLAKSDGRVLLLAFGGPLSFGAANGLIRRLSEVGGYEALVLDFTEVSMVDSSASLAIEEIILQAHGKSRRVLLAGIAPRVRSVLERLHVLDAVPKDNDLSRRADALLRADELTRPTVAAA